MSRVIHFEIHATQPQALVEFYTALFGWKISRWGEMEYWVIDTGPADQPGIHGGLVPRRGPAAAEGQPVNSFVCTVSIDDLGATLGKAMELGAAIAVPKMEIPTVGWLAYIKDPDGNILGLMQPTAKAG